MGTISPVLDRPARTAALITAEDEAITVARTIAGLFDTSDAGASAPETAEARLELLARSGLFGVSVPTEHGGIDVSNTVLADICSALAEHSETLGEIVAAQFVAVEHVRSYGTEGQRNLLFAAALAGGRLALAHPMRHGGEERSRAAITPSGLGWRLNGEGFCTPCTRHADWLLVPVRNEAGRSVGLLLPTRIDGLHYVANSCEPAADGSQAAERVRFKGVAIDGDALMHPMADAARPDVPQALRLLLDAALQFGTARRNFQRALRLADDSARRNRAAVPDEHAIAIGSLSVRLTAAEVAIENAGRAIDAAQIGSAEQHRVTAHLSATAACVTAAESEVDAGAVLEELSGRAPAARRGFADLPPSIAALLRETGRQRLAALRETPADA